MPNESSSFGERWLKKYLDDRTKPSLPEDKGLKDGSCNRTACLSRDEVFWFNHYTRKYYCPVCALAINRANRADALRDFGHDACVEEQHD